MVNTFSQKGYCVVDMPEVAFRRYGQHLDLNLVRSLDSHSDQSIVNIYT